MLQRQHWYTRTIVVGLNIDNDDTQPTLVHAYDSARPTYRQRWYTDNTGTHAMVVGLHIDSNSTQTALVHSCENGRPTHRQRWYTHYTDTHLR